MSTTTHSENSLEAPHIDIKMLSDQEKKELIAADALSITSGTTIAPIDGSFHPFKSLIINTKGIAALRLPLPPSKLEISIYNTDSTVAYLSTRKQRSSGNCVLSDAEGRQLIGTTYFFGPGRDPVLRFLDGSEISGDEIKTVSKWTSRSQRFVLPDGRAFTWDYKKEKGFGGEGKKGTALVLTMGGKRIAVLIRNDETRTPGSKTCSAGNGGELVLGEDVGGKEGILEELVVASCLLMLKKEIDRRRAVQFAIIAGAAGSG
ncbi:hypothetical protein CC78DRAFT_532715 [Lojkania enalia]|uniref:Uncharacterized protein n=1 Tax=Lojkania enalia TaxID=147567 RepID=A0A9P4KAK6_9PLEO|nr:hypothetical protein CC78DRAFT_532715 [Didymosphaeria enalia]